MCLANIKNDKYYSNVYLSGNSINDLGLIKTAIQSVIKHNKFIIFNNAYKYYNEKWWVQNLKATNLINVDVRHFDPSTSKLQDSFFWSIKYKKDIENVYAFSKNRQPLHTDNGWFNNPPKISFFIMKKQAETGGESTILPLDILLKKLRQKNLSLLEKLISYEITLSKNSKVDLNKTSIINKEGNEIYWNYYRIDKKDANIKNLCEDFFEFLENMEIENEIDVIKFNENDCYMFNDTKFLHGRKSFGSSTIINRELLHSQWQII